jgi:dTDP-4-dehydrorhamnose 3,5-epimerase/CDP-3, 6-dideoxy-D-glycero-D-glycero-4-hexulose-5-epimerase
MNINELALSGCFEITPQIHADYRGEFVKTYHEKSWLENRLGFHCKEEFYSVSKFGVFRGMHFQLPPAAHSKVVYCCNGAVLDYLVDLRKSSATYGRAVSLELSRSNGKVIFIPVGVAHGFFSLVDDSILVYKTDHIYAPDYDCGISYKSLNLQIPIDDDELILSERDRSFLGINEFETPFE